MQGLMTVFYKELADHFTSWRGIILFIMVLLVSVFAVLGPSGALDNIRQQLATPVQYGAGQFAFLYLFSTSGEGMYSFIWFIARILVPIVGIVLGLDAINSEKSSGTMSRLLSQPIYRDAVINGKFLAGVVTIAIMLTTTVLLVSAIGLVVLGVAPSSEEVARLLLFWGISILYGAFWLGLAMLFSVYFQRVATSAISSLGIWIFFSFFMSMAVAQERRDSNHGFAYFAYYALWRGVNCSPRSGGKDSGGNASALSRFWCPVDAWTSLAGSDFANYMAPSGDHWRTNRCTLCHLIC